MPPCAKRTRVFRRTGGECPKCRGGGQSRTTGSGGHRSATKRSEEKIGRKPREVAWHRSLTGRGMCPLTPVKREAFPQSPKVSIRGRRPTHKEAGRELCSSLKATAAHAAPESIRSPQARCQDAAKELRDAMVEYQSWFVARFASNIDTASVYDQNARTPVIFRMLSRRN